MNAIARIAAWALAIALVALPVVAVLNGWIGGQQWPMRRLVVTGEFRMVEPEQVQAVVSPLARRGFFAVDLAQARQRIVLLPWVEDAQVRKRWPDRLEVLVSEYRPVALWGQDRLLADSGALFARPDGPFPALPRFDGPEDRAADVRDFHGMARPLFLGQGLQVSRVELNDRGGWRLTLSDGLQIEVGRGEAGPRLARFARLLPLVRAGDPRRLVRADLRYPHGFALVWQDAGPGGADSETDSTKGSA